MVANTSSAVGDRTFEPLAAGRNPDAARAILEFRFAQEDVDRMNELAALARAGELSAEQRAEAENYSRLGLILAILKSKARRALGVTRPGGVSGRARRNKRGRSK